VQVKTEDIPEDETNNFADNAFLTFKSLLNSMMNRASVIVQRSSMSVYLSRNSDGESRLVVVQSEPEVVVHQYPELIQSNGNNRDSNFILYLVLFLAHISLEAINIYLILSFSIDEIYPQSYDKFSFCHFLSSTSLTHRVLFRLSLFLSFVSLSLPLFSIF
jgi:hypothetical protein